MTRIIPIVVVVVQVGIALGIVPIEVTDVPVAIEHGNRTYEK